MARSISHRPPVNLAIPSSGTQRIQGMHLATKATIYAGIYYWATVTFMGVVIIFGSIAFSNASHTGMHSV